MVKKSFSNKIIILLALILSICMPVTEVYAATATKTYGTDAFGETNGYLRISQGTVKSCKKSVNGATATTVTGDERYVRYYTDDTPDVPSRRGYSGDATYYEYTITDGYVYDGEKKECKVRIEYDGLSSGNKTYEAGLAEEDGNTGNPSSVTGSAGSTIKVTISNLPKYFYCVMEVTDLDTEEGWKVPSGYRAKNSVWVKSDSHLTVSDGCKVVGNHETHSDVCVAADSHKHQAFLYLKSDDSGQIVLYYYPGNTSHLSKIVGVSGSKVKYDSNGKTASNMPETDYSAWMSKLKVSSRKPTASGYKFSHWNTKSDGTGTSYRYDGTTSTDDYIASLSSGTTTLYAIWTPNKLTVSYNANGGSINTQSENYRNDINTYKHNWKYTTSKQDTINFSSFGLYRTGYHRRDGAEWNTAANGSGTAFDQDVEYTMLTYAPNLGSGNQSIVLYAQWDINQSTLTVNPNGGTWGGKTTSQSFTQNYNTTKVIANPTISNYTITFNANGGTCPTSSLTTNKAFSSWLKDSDFNAGTFSGTTFTFGSANGGAGTLTASWSGSYNITLPTPTRVGYTFEGWYKESSLTNKAGNAGASYTATATTTLYAKWKPIPYKQVVQVRYQNADGTWGAYTNVINSDYNYDSTVSWSVGETWSHEAASVSYKVTGEKTTQVNIKRRVYTLKFVKGDTNVLSVPADQTCLAGNTLSATCTSKTGYHLTKYSGTLYDGSGTGTWTECNELNSHTSSWAMHASRTITVYSAANTYYVAYTKGSTNNGGTTSTSTHTYDANVTLRVNGFTGTSYSLYFNENKPKDDRGNITAGSVSGINSSKTGTLQFKEWHITNAHNNNNTGAAAGTNIGKKNYRNDHKGTATATAKWNSVTFNNFSTPSLKGYKFNGYYTAATGGTKTTTITVDPATTAYSNILYAQWTPITYKIRFNGNDNWNTSQGSYTQTITYDKHTKLTANKFTRSDNTTYNGVLYKEGYIFVGWGTSPTQKTPTYTNEQEVFNLTATDGAIIDLYAIWKKDITLTINFNEGKFNNNSAQKVLSYTMYNSELNHTFAIKDYYGTPVGIGYYSKGINSNVTKFIGDAQYRFLGYSLNQAATIPEGQFDVFAYETRTENYNIRDDTTLYAIYEPVLQMTVSLSTLNSHSNTVKLTNAVSIYNALGTFVIPSGTKNTSLPNSTTAYLENGFIGLNVVNSGEVKYSVSAKGNNNIKFGMVTDSRILDIYTSGLDNTWYDVLNTEEDFDYKINNFSTVTDSFVVPEYLGTTLSHPSSNPNNAENTRVYGIRFTCTQPSYYYEKYWNTTESISIYGILFLDVQDVGDKDIQIPQYNDFYIHTILH